MRKVGFYGGTFDPIHFGHLNLAIALKEIHSLDEIWFCPAQISPHKLQSLSTPALHRLKMLQLATADLPYASVLTIEIDKPGPSYTVDTLFTLSNLLQADKKSTQIFLMLGDDTLDRIDSWKEIDRIVRNFPLLIGQRYRRFLPELQACSKELKESITKGLTPTPIIEICATTVRRRLERGLFCGHLLPDNVLEYIAQNKLYQHFT